MRKDVCHTTAQKPDNHSSTRDAVETAIDTAKGDNSNTWESSSRKQIPKWQPKPQHSDSDH
jgi:hypothetical protein